MSEFYETFGATKTFNQETKTYSLEFDEKSPNINLINARKLRKVWKNPITSISYQNITYRLEGTDELVIEGKEKCAKQINYAFMNLLSVFPDIEDEFYSVKPNNPYEEPYTFSIRKPKGEIDHIKKLTIKGYIEELTEALGERQNTEQFPFQVIYFERPNDEDPVPYKFTELETIDLSECVGLKKLWWSFIQNNHVKKIIFPNHEFKTFSFSLINWVDQHNDQCVLEEDADKRIKVINREYAKKDDSDDGCCTIA